MAENFDQLVANCAAVGAVDVQMIPALRRAIWGTDKVTKEVVNGLFSINSALAEPTAEFTDLFAEAIAHLLLRQEWPHNFISDENAHWLIAEISRDGCVESHAELELLIRVIEQAENSPAELQQFALKQIEAIVLTGEGPTRYGQAIQPGRVDAAEVAFLRRLVFSGAGDEDNLVGKAEAEMLFRLKDETRDADNAPEWKTFFVQAVANHLMAWSSYTPLSHDESRLLEGFMDARAAGIGGFMASVATSFGSSGLFARLKATGERTGLHSNDDANLASAHQLDAAEASWLKRQIATDGNFDDLEKAVLAFIVDEGVVLPESLGALNNGPSASQA